MLQQQQASRTDVGLRMGIHALGDGFVSGVTGVFHAPMAGAIESGTAGFFIGFGRGLVGAVTKPMSGIAAFVSKTAEGIASDAKRFAPSRLPY